VIPDDDEFQGMRSDWRIGLSGDADLRSRAVDLQLQAEKHRYTYLRDWCGVPIIRLPDDIITLQEIVFVEQPAAIIEVGIARGGGLVLDASLMQLVGLVPRVLGIDIAIYPHTHTAIRNSPFSSWIEMWQGDSTSEKAAEVVAKFIGTSPSDSKIVLILDSNHTEAHVLSELESLSPLLPVGSLILVADTLIEEFPAGYFENRPWDVGNNPLTALNKFLERHPEAYKRESAWSRRALISEFRDGVIRRIA